MHSWIWVHSLGHVRIKFLCRGSLVGYVTPWPLACRDRLEHSPATSPTGAKSGLVGQKLLLLWDLDVESLLEAKL